MKRTLLILLGLGLILNGCHSFYWTTMLNPQAAASSFTQVIQIGILKNPLQKLDQELATHFAQTFGLKYKFITFQSKDLLVKALTDKKIDLAASRFIFHEKSQAQIQFEKGPILEESELVLICNRSVKSKSDCKVTESTEAKLQVRRFPNLQFVQTIDREVSIGWYVRPDHKNLVELLHAWYQIKSRKNEIIRIIDSHTTHLTQINQNDVAEFYRRIETVLPMYKDYFMEASRLFKIPWKLLAAIAYQESHWNSNALSFTGVRGIMMLTEQTAEFVGVTDRTNPYQSIIGGARYLKYLYKRIPSRIHPNDRMMFVLAAYNVGLYHLKDAQSLAPLKDYNPDSWNDVRMLLPLLEQEEYYSQLKFGQARGKEPVIFAERVRNFYELLKLQNI